MLAFIPRLKSWAFPQAYRKFLDFIKSNYPIYDYKRNIIDDKGKVTVNKISCVYISSEKLCKDLILLGVIENKTHKERTIPMISSLQKHFWRGMFDGDGGLSESSNQWKCYLVGNINITRDFNRFIEKNTGIYYTEPRPFGSIFKSQVSGVNLPQIVSKLLYESGITFLDRKHALYLKLLKQKPKRVGGNLSYIGKKVGFSTVTASLGSIKRKNNKTDTWWECRCECGEKFHTYTAILNSNERLNCGCKLRSHKRGFSY